MTSLFTEYLFVSLFHTSEGIIIKDEGTNKLENICSKYDIISDVTSICKGIAFDILIGKKVYIHCKKELENGKIVSFELHSLRKKIYNLKLGKSYYIHKNKRYYLNKEDLILLSANKKIKKLKYKQIIKKLNVISCIPNFEDLFEKKINIDINEYVRTINEYIVSITREIGGSSFVDQYFKMSDYYILIRELRSQQLRYEIINLVIEILNKYFISFNEKYNYNISFEIDKNYLDKLSDLEAIMENHSLEFSTVLNIINNKKSVS